MADPGLGPLLLLEPVTKSASFSGGVQTRSDPSYEFRTTTCSAPVPIGEHMLPFS